MDGCQYRININGHYEEFSSEEELNSFIRKNSRTISAAMLSDKVMFSKDLTNQQKVYNEIEARSNEILFEPEQHEFTLGGEKFMSVTKVIYDGQDRLGYYMVKPFNMTDWAANQTKTMMEQKDENGQPKYTPEQIQDIIKKTKASWNTSSLIGTSWHNVAQAYFDGKVTTTADILSTFPEMAKVPAHVLSKYLTQIGAFKAGLQKKYPNALYLTEQKLFDKDNKIAGIADLLIVDESGKIHIYDYKTSLKDETLWNDQKNLSNRYQLAFYRQMLRRAGYDVGNTYIVPVNIKDVDFETNTIYDFDISLPSAKYYRETERLMQDVKKILPFSFGNKLDTVKSNTGVHQFVREAFNFEQKKTARGSVAVDKEYERLVSYTGNPQSTIWSYMPYNNNNERYPIAKSLGEQGIKTEIARILQEIDEANTRLPDQINNLVRDVKNIISEGGTIDDYEWAKWASKSSGTNIRIKSLLHKYINDPAWNLVESDALSDLNLVSFENEKTNEVDFISLSSDNLVNAPKLLVGKTILGNFVKDRQANTIGVYREATNGDVELLKAYAFIKQNKSLFVDKFIGSINAVNLLEGNRIPHIKTQTVTTLEDWYSKLIDNVPPELGLKASNWTPQVIDKSVAFVNYITGLLDDKTWRSKTTAPDKINNLLKRITALNVGDVQERTKVLGEFLAQLMSTIDNNVKLISDSDYRNTGLAIKLASEAILQLNNISTTIEDDLKLWGNFFGENANTTDPNMFKTLVMANLSKIINFALANTRLSFLDVMERPDGIRSIVSDLYNKRGSFIKIKAFGYNLDQFENMIERDANGKPLMRFKELTDKSINPDEKKFIERTMKMFNEVRIKKFIDRGKTDEWIENFMQSPDARNIPLMRASALTAFKGKDYKTFFNDFFREVMNPNNIFKEDKESQDRIRLQKEMFNAFDLYDVDLDERNDRMTRIDESKDGELETDLELVMGMYMMANSKQEEVTKQMPIINALKTTSMIGEIFDNNPTPITNKLVRDYIETTIFGKTILGGESPTIAKASKVLQETTSLFVLGLSPFAGTTEMITGFFGNVSRLIAGKYNQHGFSFANYTKAHAIVGGNLFSQGFSYELVNLCDSLNEIYGISDMDVKQMVHEMQTTSKGLTHFKSKYAYWFNTFPGYFNRMVLLVASSIEKGVLDVDGTGKVTKNSAYQMVDGRLVYNEKLDKRFSLYTNAKDTPEGRQTTEWKNQRALYTAIKNELEKEPGGIKADGTLGRPYDNRQRLSLKEFADEVHGSYDTENKTNMQKMAFGRIFMQFKGWIRAKKNRYYTETGQNDKRGHYELDTDENGNPVYNWKGKVTEGIWQTTMAMYDEIVTNKGNVLKAWDSMNDTQKENFMFLLSDTVILGLLSLIASLLSDPHMKEENPVQYQAVNSLRNSSHDFFIGYTVGSVAGTKNPVALVSWGTKVAQDSWSVVTGGKDPSDLLKNVAVYRTLSNITKTAAGAADKVSQ